MPRIAKRLYGPAQLTTTATTIYTVPAVTKAIIRHIHVSNPTGGAVTLTASIGADTTATRIFDAYSIAAGAVFDHFCYYIMEAAEVFQANAGTATAITITIDGDESVLG